ncbi:acylphosphatase [Microbacterium sp. LRZ72]|uniref:acylphosphatase n=1 Tax=Microbacterium sp. LRZ72 TaxID=2942481 RepID=UPI0029B1F6B6|nr:acylphosphatase [Microbacterium sp. LRZ72]MDX2376822.1 acylphosphatase [Microbacterium sp. LRZ72]
MRRVRVTATGRVQGVGFRVAARSEALRLGVSGWIRNRDGDAVEAEIEGTSADVDAMLEWMGRGPGTAAVTEVSVTDVAPTGGSGFDIRL